MTEYFTSEKCLRYDNGMLGVSDADKEIVLKGYPGNFINTKF